MATDLQKAEKAKITLDKKGRKITFVKEGEISSDLNQPWRGTVGAAKTFDTIGVFISYESKDIDGELIRVFDKKVLVNAIDSSAYDLSTFDKIIDGSTTWKIQNVKALQPANQIILNEVQVRK